MRFAAILLLLAACAETPDRMPGVVEVRRPPYTRLYCSGVVVGSGEAQRLLTAHHCASGQTVSYLTRDAFHWAHEGLQIGDLSYCVTGTTHLQTIDGYCAFRLRRAEADFAELGSCKPGSDIYASGGSTYDPFSVTRGSVTRYRDEWVYTTAPTQPGFSGGGVFNERSQLCGVITHGNEWFTYAYRVQ